MTTIKLKEQNEFSPVSRSHSGGSECLEPFFPKVVDAFTKLRVRGVPDNAIRLEQCWWQFDINYNIS